MRAAGSASHGTEKVSGSRTSATTRTSGQRPTSGSAPAPASQATSAATTAASAAARRRAQYGGSSAHHGPSALKAFQNAVFAAWSSSAASMSGVTSASIVGVKRRTTPDLGVGERVGERELQRVEESHGLRRP